MSSAACFPTSRYHFLYLCIYTDFFYFYCILFKAEAETNDNLQFLSTLLPWFEKLHYATKSAEMVSVFPPLMHTMYLVWVYSRLVLHTFTNNLLYVLIMTKAFYLAKIKKFLA